MTDIRHVLRCHQCQMVFPTINQLSLHRQKFCIGANRYEGDQHKEYHSSVYKDKINQLLQLKEKATKKQLETEAEQQKMINRLKSRLEANRQTLPVTQLSGVNGETVPVSLVESLLFQNRSKIQGAEPHIEVNPLDSDSYIRLLKEIYGDKIPLHIVQRLLSEDSNTVSQLKMKLHQQVRTLDDHYKSRTSDYRNENTKLKQTVSEIEKQLSQLAGQKVSELENQALNHQKQELQQRTLLQDLKEYINQTLNYQRSGPPVPNQPAPHQPAPHQPAPNADPFSFQGGGLVAEISALRQHYVNKGGHNPSVLTQLSEMLRDAEDLDRQPTVRSRPSRQRPAARPTPDNGSNWTDEMVALEVENYRLQRELLMLEHKQSNEASKPDVERDNERDKLQRDHLQKMLAQEREIEFAKHQALLDKMKRDLEPPTAPTAPTDRNFHYNKIAPIQYPSVYDPTYGFTCFYDFVTGLDSHMKTCKLIIGLYSKVSELGKPSLLPTVYTENTALGNTAIVGAKQPVPQCPADPSLSLVIEVQTSENMTADRMKTTAWCKVDLFNNSGLLLAGSWKIRLQAPPIQPNGSSRVVFSNQWIYLRLVNHFDAEAQTNMQIGVLNNIDYREPR